MTGFVEDIRSYLIRANVCVIPLRIARGIQNKLLEAMSMGKAIVCTPQAMEGISATHARELCVADDNTNFAEAVIRVLADDKLRKELGSKARQCVEKHYAWERNLSALDTLLNRNSERIPRGLSQRSGDPACGAAGSFNP